MKQVELLQRVQAYETPSRAALSTRFPFLRRPVIAGRRIITTTKNQLNSRLRLDRRLDFYPCVIARHQSVLIRTLGDSDQKLQQGKIVNLQRAVADLNGLVIEPGKVFSLWHALGNPTYGRGYVDGMLLSNGQVITGVGGGLCQLSNFLCWLLLHAQTEIVERYHHSMDVFPDSGRVLPFGSGATCLYNFIDLKIKNTGTQPIQLKIWVTAKHLKGQLVSPKPSRSKFSIQEAEHLFVLRDKTYYRTNEIWRIEKIEGREIKREKIFTNFAPVLYPVTKKYLTANNFKVIDLTNCQH